jgi:peptidoglycan/LPS O-acetylase OafA/YrhL
VALTLDCRTRIALAAAVAVLLGWGQVQGFLYRWPQSAVLAYLGRISYAVFLMNFPVALVVNAAFTRFAPAQAGIQTLGVIVAWLACIAVGAAFYHFVEEPLRRLGQRWFRPTTAA